MKNVINIIIKMGLVLICAICIGIVLLFMAYLIPVDSMKQNLRESIPVFEYEGTYPELVGWSTSYLDNYTDSLMLLSAVYEDNTTVLNQVFKVCSEQLQDYEPVQSLVKYFAEDKVTYVVPYPRYWHGYLIFLKPLLSIMNYNEIRIFNVYLQIASIMTLLYVIAQVGKKRYILPTLLLMGLLPIISTAWSLQKSSVYYIFIIGSTILLLKYLKWRDTDKIFFLFQILGIATSYFDLMSYPLVTFGIPISFYFCLDENPIFFEQLKTMIKFGLSWVIGYGGMWLGKWVVGSMFTGQNIILDAVEAMKVRTSMTSGWGEEVKILEMLSYNAKAFIKNPSFIFVSIFCIIMLYKIIKYHKIKVVKSNLIFALIACLPIVWYVVTPNHSMTHWWLFTYKEFGITAFAIMCFCVKQME